MSKEKQCECCHEWWYASVIKEGLCPNCYDYFKQLKQQLTKKVKTIEVLRDLQKYNTTQLAEKQNVIDDINKKFVQAVHDWKTLCKKKDKEISKLQASCQQDKTQLAIQELEKVKILLQNAVNYEGYDFVGIYDAINNQIKELKGEK